MATELEQIFMKLTLLDSWATLLQAYEEMGFTDELTDDQRIKEFTEIVKLMNDWIAKVEKVVTPHWPFNKDDGIKAFQAMNCKLKLDTRVKIVYAEFRDRWNDSAISRLEQILLEEAQRWAEEEEEDNGTRDQWNF